jgi:hypothetical protein
MPTLMVIAGTLLAAAPQAQTEPASPEARHSAGVAAANRHAESMSELQRAAAEAHYQADMASWLAAMEARGEQIAADRSAYLRQQRSYAEAMAAWRVQVAACRAGATAACTQPPPDPADFR